jgi:hypothetical protein
MKFLFQIQSFRHYFLSFSFLLIVFFKLSACENVSKDSLTKGFIEFELLTSNTGYVPFWNRSLQFGAIPYQSPTQILKGFVGKEYLDISKNEGKKFDWKYGFEAVAFWGIEKDFRLIETYISGKFKNLELRIGRKKEIIGLGDSTLTSGFWSLSGNSMPSFKYKIGTLEYLDVFKGHIGLNFGYGDGLLDNFGPISNAFIHQKFLYARFGKRNAIFNFNTGINHNVSWGGETKIKTGGNYDFYPSDFTTYFYVVLPLNKKSIVPLNPNSVSKEEGYQFGNHLGSIDISINFKSKFGTILVYKQTPYETGRIASLSTSNDGISGISWKINKSLLINHFVFEYIYTANQGNYVSGLAQFLGLKDPHLTEIESYYTNGRGGWHYFGKGMGTPLIPINRESIFDDNFSKSENSFSFYENAIKSIYIGFSGFIVSKIIYELRFVISKYSIPRNNLKTRILNDEMTQQLSSQVVLSGKLNRRLNWNCQIGYDQGEKLHNSIGLILGFKNSF